MPHDSRSALAFNCLLQSVQEERELAVLEALLRLYERMIETIGFPTPAPDDVARVGAVLKAKLAAANK
jgi:hypothetical protein